MPGIVSAKHAGHLGPGAAAHLEPAPQPGPHPLAPSTRSAAADKASPRPAEGLMPIIIAAVITIMRMSLAKSSRSTERKMLMRSVSVLTREIRSPVRFPPKNSSESRCKWA